MKNAVEKNGHQEDFQIVSSPIAETQQVYQYPMMLFQQSETYSNRRSAWQPAEETERC